MSTLKYKLANGTKNNMVQVFRALAIIAVVMIHTCPSAKWQVVCRPFINFAVATFLFLSGYLTKTENEDWGAFYKKRIIRVLIPYLIWSILYSLPAIHNNSKGIERLFFNLFTTKASFHFYYIFVYIQFVLLTPFLSKLAKSKCQILGWLVAPISILVCKYYGLLMGIDLNKYVSFIWSYSCLGWFSFYYLGLILGNRIIEKNFSLRFLSMLYIISIVLQMLEGYGWLLLGEWNCGTQLKLTSLLTSTLFLLIIDAILKQSCIDIKNKCLRLLGDHSFGIYMCHIMIMIILERIPYYNLIPFPVNSAIVILLSLSFCYIGNRICGTKISRWLGLK